MSSDVENITNEEAERLSQRVYEIAATDDTEAAEKLTPFMPKSTLFAAWLLFKTDAPNCARVFQREWSKRVNRKENDNG